MEQKKSNTKIIIAAVIIFVVIIGVLAAVYFTFTAKPVEGTKNITVEVIAGNGEFENSTFEIKTDAEYLGEALQEENLIEGEEGPYGLYVKSVNGYTADESKQQWWSFSKNGEFLNTSADLTVIADGEKYEITLVTGW